MPTQSDDVSGGQFGIRYASAGLTWTVLGGVDVSGSSGGVFSEFANSTLINSGSISSTIQGAWFAPEGASGSYVIDNRSGGIIAARDALVIDDFAGAAKVINAGKIGGTAAASAMIITGSSAVTIENTGEIAGQTGVSIYVTRAGASGPTVDNHGTIAGIERGISVYEAVASKIDPTATITNHKDGVISAEGIAVSGLNIAVSSSERLILANEGKVIGEVVGSAFGDKVTNEGLIDGGIWLGAGNDSFQNKGKGSSGVIDSGAGNDKITLGNKVDRLVLNSALDAQFNVDRIKNFTSGKDKLYLDEEFFSGLPGGTLASSAFRSGKSAKDGNDHIIYDKKSGAVRYDPDGEGGQKAVALATLDKNTKLKASDFAAGEYSVFS